MTFYEFVIAFTGNHPFLTFVAILAAYFFVTWPFRLVKRAIRSRDIQKHGWPDGSVDADGDFEKLSGK